MNAVRRGYFSEEEESNESSTIASTRMSLVPAPRSLPAPTPQELPQRASGWLAQEPGLFMWDRECIGHAVVKAVDVAPTVLVTETVVISLQNSADGVLGSLARSTRVGTLVDLAEVPSTARHARHMVVLHSDKSVATALGTYASEVEVELRNGHGPSSDQPRPGAVRLRYGPAPGQAHRYTLRVRLEASLPKLSARCSVLRRPPRLAKTRLAAELLRDGGRDLNARFGYVALDESRRAVVLLEDDPVTQSVPLVGAWVSGLIATGRTDACAEPAVLEACASFFSRKDTWCVEPQTALLVLFASRGGPAHDVICVEATAILADRNQGAADRQVVDYVADLVDPSLSEQEDKSKRPRAVLAARLLPRDLSELPLEPPPPTSPAPDVLTAVSEPQDDAADRYSLEAQLNELRRRLDELEAKSAMPTTARREIATETTSTLLMQQKPAAKITTAQQTDEVTTPPSTPACPPNTRSNDSPMPIAPLPVETHSRTDDDHLETLTADATDLQPRVDDDELPGEHRRDAHSLNLAAACHVRQPNICRDLASNETMSLATMPNAETIDLPRIVCPRDVQDLLYQAEDDYLGYEDMSAPSGDAIFSARRDASPLIDIDTQLGHSYSEGWTTSLLVDPNLEGEGSVGSGQERCQKERRPGKQEPGLHELSLQQEQNPTTDMTDVDEQKIRACLLGAFVADAASMPTHWIYDPEEMMKSVSSIEAPEFKSPATPKFYSSAEFPGHYESGSLSPYGEQLLFVSQWAAEVGSVSGAEMCNAMKKWATEYTGRKDSALLKFLANVADGAGWPDCGADDSQAHMYTKVVPITALYVGSSERRAKVEEAIRVHQNNELAVEYGLVASDILERVIFGDSLADAIAAAERSPGAANAFDKAASALSLTELLKSLSNEKMKDKPDSPYYNLAARSCALPGSFISPMHQLLRLAQNPGAVPFDAYAAAVRENIIQGAGDTCSRAIFLGAVLAAAYGGPPQDWIENLTTAQDTISMQQRPIVDLVRDLSGKVVAHNKGKRFRTS